jgi:hypothetical protein
MLGSAKLLFRGPLWKLAGLVSAVLTTFGAIQFIRGQSFWMWFCFAALAVAVTSFYTFHRQRLTVEEKAEMLPSKIEALTREGMKLLNELAQAAEPSKKKDSLVYELFPDAVVWSKAEAFDQRIRELFVEFRPTLLFDYADGANASLRKYREKEAQKDKEEKDLDDAEKLRRFVERAHEQPTAYVQAFLSGLAAARHRLGD